MIGFNDLITGFTAASFASGVLILVVYLLIVRRLKK